MDKDTGVRHGDVKKLLKQGNAFTIHDAQRAWNKVTVLCSEIELPFGLVISNAEMTFIHAEQIAATSITCAPW